MFIGGLFLFKSDCSNFLAGFFGVLFGCHFFLFVHKYLPKGD